jgi:hypothetical protein
LEFIVSGQTLTKDPRCDFSGIAAGSRGYLFARFRFSKDWAGCKKAAVFTTPSGQEYPVGLGKDNLCEIPAEALTGKAVRVMVVGRRNGGNIPTTEIAFPQTVRKGGTHGNA